MEQNNKKYYLTAFVLYLNYFIHGIGVSILAQYKQQFAMQWGAKKLANGSFDVSSVVMVIAALGLGRLIALPIAGPLSDKLGRRIASLIGIVSYIIFFVGIALSPSASVAYLFALMGGIANSFLDTGVIPACMEILVKSTGLATILTKLGVSLGQFVLPMMLGYVAGNQMSYKTLFFVMPALFVIIAVFTAIMPMPKSSSVKNSSVKEESLLKKIKSVKFTPTSIALILIGFTCTSTFQLWLNCIQEFAKSTGLKNPSVIQSYYSIGTIIAVLVTAALVGKSVKPVKILFVYPLIALIMLVIVYVVKTPQITIIGGFVIGYSAAGGVLQMATATINDMFPTIKGTITSIIMIASSAANYAVLSVAGAITRAYGVEGPKYVLLLNIGITFVGVLLALYVNMSYAKATAKADSGAAVLE
ncbi:MFS transporter [Clostridium sp. SYSU_GA19001]|uniref:MFS transporter n=1 Tax=Clostridium caldaquaticum TaxID=2940653 RepID=UPI0020777507|nr:MFS transporter [Clostridium caldaquaticum]MCM8711593.1 MFS transporter [Clostridium caldaquaticum]